MRIFVNDNFKPTRIKNGFSIIGLSKEIGITKQSLGQIERRVNGISPGNSKKILELFKVEFDDIFTIVDSKNK